MSNPTQYVLIRRTESNPEYQCAIADITNGISFASIEALDTVGLNPDNAIGGIAAMLESPLWEALPVSSNWPTNGPTDELEAWCVQQLALDDIIGTVAAVVKTIEVAYGAGDELRDILAAEMPFIDVSCRSGGTTYMTAGEFAFQADARIRVVTTSGTRKTAVRDNCNYRDRALWALCVAASNPSTYQYVRDGTWTRGIPVELEGGDGYTFLSTSVMSGTLIIPNTE